MPEVLGVLAVAAPGLQPIVDSGTVKVAACSVLMTVSVHCGFSTSGSGAEPVRNRGLDDRVALEQLTGVHPQSVDSVLRALVTDSRFRPRGE